MLNRRRSTPVPAWVLVAGRSLTAIGISLATMVALLAVRPIQADATQPTVQAIRLPLYLISGVFIPNVNMPGWLASVSGAEARFCLQIGLTSRMNRILAPHRLRKAAALSRTVRTKRSALAFAWGARIGVTCGRRRLKYGRILVT